MTRQRPAGASGIVSGVRGRLFAGMTMALRRPHERTKMARRRVAQTRANLRCTVSGGQDPALQSPLPTPLDSGLRRNDESGVCFHSNRSCRLAPAHQGMKSRRCGLVQRIVTAGSATPHPDPSGGQAPALHSPLPAPLDSGFRRNHHGLAKAA